jgi:GNAT superfamily N-acetyltransferase
MLIPMAHTIHPFDPAMAPDAARIFTAGFAALRRKVPVLPDILADRATVATRIGKLAGSNPAVAATDGDRLLGYLTGVHVPSFKGPTDGYFVPEFAHGVDQALDASSRARLYHELYAAIAPLWMEHGGCTHGISLLESDLLPLEVFVWNGFGICVVDAVRGTHAISPPSDVAAEVSVAGPGDAELLAGFENALNDELAASPIYRHPTPAATPDELAARIARDTERFWVARAGGAPAGYIAAQLAVTDCADIVQAPDTVNVVGAWVDPAHRRGHIATALLATLISWARERSAPRIGLDFESQNAPARAFWLAHFTPVVRALIRHVDSRLA